MKIIFEIIIMVSDELDEIFSTLKNFYDKKLVLYEKIARISEFSRNHLCYNMFMTLLNQVVSVYKEITIDNVIFLNIMKILHLLHSLCFQEWDFNTMVEVEGFINQE